MIDRGRLRDIHGVTMERLAPIRQLGIASHMLTTDRPNPSPTRVGSTSRNRALSSYRLQAFLQEPPRDGNIAVMLPDCTPKVKVNKGEKESAMNAKIKTFYQQWEK